MYKFNIVLTIALCLLCSPIFAGSLEPGASPSSTMKTLSDIEPRTAIPVGTSFPIDIKSGSYYLTGNISASTTAIHIIDSNVTLDLNGFTIDGKNTGQYGIRTIPPSKNIKICNGTIANWQTTGIDTTTSPNCIIENITVNNITAGVGISAGKASVVKGCLVNGCSSYGIQTDANCVISDSTCFKSSYGIFTGANCYIFNCTNSQNASHGFYTWQGSTIRNCVANNNGTHGFSINLGSSCSDCSASYNGNSGFFADSNSMVVSCNAANNKAAGITLYGSSIARNNNCTGHMSTPTSAGIVISLSSLSMVEGNTCFNNKVGIYDYSDKSIIIKNVCYTNSSHNYDTSSPKCAPIITAADLAGASNPLCNLEF